MFQTDMAEKLTASLELIDHPSGGKFKEIFRGDRQVNVIGEDRYDGPRCTGTVVHYLMSSDQTVPFHKHIADAQFFWHAGHVAKVHLLAPDGSYKFKLLGNTLTEQDAEFCVIVPNGTAYAIELTDKTQFVLWSCAIVPGFEYKDWKVLTTEELLQQYPDKSDLVKRLATPGE